MLGAAHKYSDSSGVPAALIYLACSLYVLGTVYSLAPAEERRRSGGAFLGAVVCFMFLGVAVYPVLLSAKVAAQQSNCISAVKDLGMSLLTYATDHDDRLPPAYCWRSAPQPHGESEGRCAIGRSPWTYAFNLALSSFSQSDLAQPAETVMLFEADAWERNAAGGREWFALRHSRRGTVGFTDGHAARKGVTDDTSKVIWTPIRSDGRSDVLTPPAGAKER